MQTPVGCNIFYMNPNKYADIIFDIDSLWSKYYELKAHFPYANESSIGLTKVHTADYYRQGGHNITFDFVKPLDKEKIARLNELGHYINQNVIIRLHLLLEAYKIIGNKVTIDVTLSGADEVDILRRLRRLFAHTMGNYNNQDREQQKLVKRIVKHFNLPKTEYHDFPIFIDVVIKPIFDGIKTYIEAVKIKYPTDNK